MEDIRSHTLFSVEPLHKLQSGRTVLMRGNPSCQWMAGMRNRTDPLFFGMGDLNSSVSSRLSFISGSSPPVLGDG